MLTVPFLLAIEAPNAPVIPLHIQRDLMIRLIGVTSHTGGQMIYPENQFGLFENGNDEDVCTWRGVTCTNGSGIVCLIEWLASGPTSVRLREFYTRWFPPTARGIEIEGQQPRENGSHDAFEVRFLPRVASRVVITSSWLFGTLDMGALPSEMIIFDLSNNHLSGTVFLGNLPRMLASLIMSGNQFEKVIVDNKSLPKHLMTVNFGRMNRPIKAYTIDGSTLDPRVYVKEEKMR